MLSRAKMESICSLVTDGTHDSPKLQPVGIPFIKGKHISQGFVDFENCDFITEEDHIEACRRVKPSVGDVLFSNIGSVGDTARVTVDREFSIKNVALFRPDPTKVDPGYFYYLVANPHFNKSMLSLRSGSAQPFITLGSLRGYETSYHTERSNQLRIASILSAYDGLIENNTRRIAILEEMGRRIYEEWFVRFRFPGHEDVRMVMDESGLGLVPDGWEVRRFADLLESWRGGDWGSDEPTDNDTAPVFVIRGTDIDDLARGTSNRVPARFIEPKSLEKRRLKPFDLVVENSINAKSRSAGKTLLVTPGLLNRLGGDAIAASFCKVFRFHDQSVAPLAHMKMRQLFESGDMTFFQNVAANGIANFQAQRFVANQFVLLPTEPAARGHTLNMFDAFTTSTLADAISNLRTTRDLLLPKLISGEIDVSTLPEPEAVAT